MLTTKVRLASAYKPLFDKRWRHIVFHGGRASGKSTATGYALLIRGRQEKLRIVCGREFQNSIEQSVHALLGDIIQRHEFTDYVVTDNEIRNKLTGTQIIFKGLHRNSQAIKSLEGADICWVEEAQTITKETIDILIPTVRKSGSQLIWTFNRLTELDPVWVELCQDPDDDTYIGHVNSDVLERVGMLPDTSFNDREKMRRRDPDLFAHIWLGEPMSQLDNAILGRDKVIEAMDRTDADPEGAIEVGADIARFGDDRTVFYKRKGHRIIDVKVYTKLRTTEVCDKLEAFVDYDKSVNIKVDDTGVGGGVTDEMFRREYKVVPINFGAVSSDPDKYPNLISEAWFYMASIIDQIQLPMDTDLLQELSGRLWKMDSKGRRGVERKDDYKKRGNRSPDKADALILCFFDRDVQPFPSSDDDNESPSAPITSGLMGSNF